MNENVEELMPTLETNQKLHEPQEVPSLASVLARPVIPLVSEHDDMDTGNTTMMPNRVKEESDDNPQKRLLERLQKMSPINLDADEDITPTKRPKILT